MGSRRDAQFTVFPCSDTGASPHRVRQTDTDSSTARLAVCRAPQAHHDGVRGVVMNCVTARATCALRHGPGVSGRQRGVPFHLQGRQPRRSLQSSRATARSVSSVYGLKARRVEAAVEGRRHIVHAAVACANSSTRRTFG